MYISHETTEQSDLRLRQVIKHATLKIYNSPYCFKETGLKDDYVLVKDALAFVRDEEVASFLVPATGTNEKNKIFRFHFIEGEDNSGFVGWLAGMIKSKTGAGVFVVCGHNSQKGGIFDYWGCSMKVAKEVIELIDELRNN